MEQFRLVPGSPFYHWSATTQPMTDHLLFSYSRHAMLAFLSFLRSHKGLDGINLLFPEYMCHEVINAVSPYCDRVSFFPQNEDFTFDLAKLAAQCEEENVNVLMYSHLYGRFRTLDDVRTICEERDIVLLEDSAHLPWIVLAHKHQYSHARFFTHRKLFALPYGASIQICPEWREAFADFRTRHIPNVVEPHGALAFLKWLAREQIKKRIVQSGVRWKRTYTELGTDPLKHYNGLTSVLEYSVRHLNTQGFVTVRKRNYEVLRQLFSSRLSRWYFVDCGAADDVPYHFLIYRNEPIDSVAIIKQFLQRGISAVKGLELSSKIIQRLGPCHPFNNQIGLPIHQDVTQEQMDYIKAVCLEVLS